MALTTAAGDVATRNRADGHHQQVVPSGASAAVAGTLSVTTSAQSLIAASTTRRSAMVRNPSNSGATIYYGFTSGLTTANGFPIYPGEAWTTAYNGAIYLIGDSAVTARYSTESD